MNKSLKISLCILLALALVGALMFIIHKYVNRYDPNDFIGLNSIQIIERHGEFDNISMPAGPDGMYRNCSCGYIVSSPSKGFLGTTPGKVFMIYFDENGLAYNCAYETGGKGG